MRSLPGNASVKVPASVTIPAGATSASFSASTMFRGRQSGNRHLDFLQWIGAHDVRHGRTSDGFHPAVRTSLRKRRLVQRLHGHTIQHRPGGRIGDRSLRQQRYGHRSRHNHDSSRRYLWYFCGRNQCRGHDSGNCVPRCRLCGRIPNRNAQRYRSYAFLAHVYSRHDSRGDRCYLHGLKVGAPAPAGGLPVTLSSNNASLTVPASVIVPAGSVTVVFPANTASVRADQSAAITASANAITQSASVLLVAPVQLTSLSCNPASVPNGSSATCTVALAKAAPAGGALVALSGGNAALSIPASVTVAPGATSATFVASGSATTTQTVPLTASWNGVLVSFTVTALAPQPVLSILGNPSELTGVTNGATVTPTIAPARSLTGNRKSPTGGGSVNFAPDQNGNGVYFQSCCTNASNAYYKFTGTAVGSIFNFTTGQVASCKSSSDMAQRATAASYRSVVDVRDGNPSNHLVSFTTQVSAGNLIFFYSVGGQTQYYYVPKGTENTLFGNGVTMQVAVTWAGSTLHLYLNGTLVKSTPYTPPTPNWTSASVFDLGAYEYQAFGGYDSCDDIIGEFTVGPVTQN